MTDIQETFSHTLYSSYDELSVLGNPRLVTVELELIMLSDATFAIFHFPVAESVLEYLTGTPQINAPAKTNNEYNSITLQARTMPDFWLSITQFSIHPHA